MCTGKLIRFFCPEARKENKLCPNYNTTSGVIKDHRKVWMHSEFKCCGRHAGPCVECEDLYEPKNVKVVNAWAVLCDGCGARLRSDIKAIMDAVDATSDSENLSDQRSVIVRKTDAATDEKPTMPDDESGQANDDESICDCPKCTQKRLKGLNKEGCKEEMAASRAGVSEQQV